MRAWWLCLACAACSFQPAAALPGPDGPGGPGPGPGTPDAARSDAPSVNPPDAPPDAAAPDAMPSDAGPPSLGFVQAATGVSFDGSTVSVALPAPDTAGDFIIIGVSWIDTSSSIANVADTDGNTYTQVGSPLVKSNVAQLAIYAAWNIQGQGATNTVTITASRSDADPIAVVGEYRGVETDSNPVDVMAGKAGAPPGAPDSTKANTTNAHDLLVGIGAADTNMGAGTGFTARTFPGLDVLEDQTVTTTGSDHATATQAPNGTVWLMRMVAVRAAD